MTKIFRAFRSLNCVFSRILLLVLLALGAVAAVGAFVIYESRVNLYEQKKNDIRHVVETAHSIVVELAKRVDNNEMTKEQAQAEAKRIINAMRYDANEYVFIYDFNGALVVNRPKPELIGKPRLEEKDAAGEKYVQAFVDTAKSGRGGHVFYWYVRPQSTEIAQKVSYVTGYMPWGWAIASGALIEDIEALHERMTRKIEYGLAAIAVLLLGAAFLVTRSIIGPLNRLTGSLRQLASGDTEAEVAGSARGDEFGTIARAVVDVREAVRGQMGEQMQRDLASKEQAETERRQFLNELAQSLDQQVKAVTDTLGSAAQQLVGTAQSMQQVSDQARVEADGASAASRLASEHVSTVGQATEQLNGSIGEINSQVHDSAKISEDAVKQIREASTIVRTLSETSADIGKVISLIQAIAEQTNLLALNATIEAARAGDAGRGFAVVASEVKQLATQTSKATEEISGRITAVQAATNQAVAAIDNVDATIARISEIGSTIASAVEEQGAATSEITRAIGETVTQTDTLSLSLTRLHQAANETNSSSQAVVESATTLSNQAASLKQEVEQFVARIARA
jgi:methyl-accepting chemotaxis protein